MTASFCVLYKKDFNIKNKGINYDAFIYLDFNYALYFAVATGTPGPIVEATVHDLR